MRENDRLLILLAAVHTDRIGMTSGSDPRGPCGIHHGPPRVNWRTLPEVFIRGSGGLASATPAARCARILGRHLRLDATGYVATGMLSQMILAVEAYNGEREIEDFRIISNLYSIFNCISHLFRIPDRCASSPLSG